MPPTLTALAAGAPALLVSRGAAEDLESLRRTAKNGTYVFMDDSRNDVFRFPSSSSWIVDRNTAWAGGTQTTFDGDGGGEFEVTVFGESVSFVGSAPLPSSSQPFLVSIDGADPFGAQFTEPSSSAASTPPSSSSSAYVYRTWYTTTYVPSRPRPIRITLSRLPRGLSVDYVILKAYNTTGLLENQIMVDDNQSIMEYSGSWNEQRSQTGSVRPGSALELLEPFGGGVHSSGRVGDTVRIIFQGTSISLFSHFTSSENGTGTITASYSLDDEPAERRTYATSSASSTLDSVVPNYPLYSLSNLPSRMHALTLTILESTGDDTSLNLDYITYRPGYSTLLDLLEGNNGVGAVNGSQPGAAIGKGPLAGIIVGILFAVMVLLWVFCCRGPRQCWRMVRHRRKKTESGKETSGSSGSDKGKGVCRYSTEFEFKIQSVNSETDVTSNPTDDPSGKLDLNAILRSNSPPPVHLNTAVMKPPSTYAADNSHSQSRSHLESGTKEDRRRRRSITSLGSSLLDDDDDDSDHRRSVDSAVGRVTPFILPAFSAEAVPPPMLSEKSKSALAYSSPRSTSSPENIITPFIVPPLPPSTENVGASPVRTEKSALKVDSKAGSNSSPSPSSSSSANGKRPLPHPPTSSSPSHSPSPSHYHWHDRKTSDHHHEVQSQFDQDHDHESHYQEQRSRRQSIQNELDRLVLLAESLHDHHQHANSSDEQHSSPEISAEELEDQQRILGEIARLVGELDELAREMERGLGEGERPPAYSPQLGDSDEGEAFGMGVAL